ncbi:hypothetical protein ACFVS2_20685 [Brevibacillus sp. NPDC058079]|uniref:hypothetical protein n=1 Tax=Brevibacillus sp. NPDC058079 TaxID=3346330 RepID=UPI0036E8BD31
MLKVNGVHPMVAQLPKNRPIMNQKKEVANSQLSFQDVLAQTIVKTNKRNL